MAGEWLIGKMNGKGGKDSDYADIMYGIVTSVKPLKVQLSNQMIITDDFITLGKHIGKFKVKGKAKVKSHTDTIEPITGTRPTVTESVELTIDNGLKEGDKVTLMRGNGGQKFYLFERKGTDGFGF